MVDALVARSPLALPRGRHGVLGPVGVTISEVPIVWGASLAARAPGPAALAAALGWELPAPGRWIEAEGAAVLWTGPQRWLLLAPQALDLRRVGAAGSVTEQGDSRIVVEIAGPPVREVLRKGVPIDLHPAAFGPGRVAATLAGHVNALVWQTGPDIFRLAVARSFAGSFADWLLDAAAGHGYQIG